MAGRGGGRENEGELESWKVGEGEDGGVKRWGVSENVVVFHYQCATQTSMFTHTNRQQTTWPVLFGENCRK